MSDLTASPEQEAALAAVSRFIVRFGLTVPTILALESMRQLSYVGSQFMHMMSPSIAAFLPMTSWDALAELLEDRRGLDLLLDRIEATDAALRALPS